MGTVEFRLSSTGERMVAAGFSRVETSIARAGRAGTRAGMDISRGMQVATGWLGKLVAVAGLAGAGKKVLEFSEQLGLLQIEARNSVTEMKAIEEQVLKIASSSGVMSGEIVSALRVFQGFGGILQFGRDMMEDMVMLTKATGTPMSELATIASSLHKTMGLTKEETVDAFAAMKSMSIAGTLTMAQTAPDLPGILGMAKGYGFRGMHAVRQLGAAQQVVGELVPSSAESSTALTGLLSDLTKKARGLRGIGVKVFDKGKMADVDKIMLQIFGKIGGDPEKMSAIFKREGRKAAAAFLSSYDPTTKGWRKGSNVEAIFAAGRGASSEDLRRDAEMRGKGVGAPAGAVKRAKAKAEAALHRYGGQVAGFAAENPWTTAGLLGGGYAALKLLPKLGGRLLGGKGGAAGLVAAAAGGGLPVRVMNWPGSSLGSASSGARSLAPAALGGAGLGLTVALPAVIGMAAGAFDFYQKRKMTLERVAETKAAAARVAAAAAKVGVKANLEGDADQQARMKLLEKPQEFAAQVSLTMLGQLVPSLKNLTKALQSPPVVKVEPSKGLDSVNVQRGRGSV